MMRRRLYLLALVGIILQSVFLISMLFIKEVDPRFTHIGYDYQFNGKEATGIVYDLHPNGRLSHVMPLYRGKKVWNEWFWFSDGAPMALRPHKAGKPHGEWKQWYPDGQPRSLRTYIEGVITGEVWGWHANGQISDYNVYVDGQEITHKSWVADGTPFYNYVYQNGKKVGVKGGDFCKRLYVMGK